MENFKVKNIDTGIICDVIPVPQGDGTFKYNISWDAGTSYFRGTNQVEVDQRTLDYYMASFLVKMEEEVQLPHTFMFKPSHVLHEDEVYSAVRSNDGLEYTVYLLGDDGFPSLVYGSKDVAGYVKNGTWVIQPETFVDTSETEAEADAQFGGVEYDQVWFDELADFDVSLAHIREFSKETGSVVEICADFYTVYTGFDDRPLLAKTAEELTAIMQAVRVFRKAVDNG